MQHAYSSFINCLVYIMEHKNEAMSVMLNERLSPVYTLVCMDVFHILQHLRHGHGLLPLRVQLPVHEQSRFPNSPLKARFCTQLLHLL